MRKKFFIILLVVPLLIGLSSCDLLDMFVTKYNVAYYNDGSLVKEETVLEDSLIKAPTIEEKEGYEFLGWFKDLNDESSIWNFETDLVKSNLRLDVKWELKINYLEVANIIVLEESITWDEIPDAEYKISFLEKTFQISENEFNLTEYQEQLKEEKLLIIEPVKETFTGLKTEVKIFFNQEEIIEAYRMDFEPFDYPDFTELNRSTYKTSTIDHDDHFLYVAEGRLTNINQIPKNDVVALILRENGVLELKEAYENFVGIKFDLGNFNNYSSTSKLNLYISNDPLTGFELVDTYHNEGSEGFTTFEVTLEDLPETINPQKETYLKFTADISGSSARNIVLDDIIVYQIVPAYFSLNISGGDVELDEYYASAQGLKGEELVERLRIIVSTNLNDVNYRDYKEIGEHADYQEENKSVVIGIYDGRELKANWGSRSEWHREHVWPNSRLGMERVKETQVNQGSDPHNLRAIYPSTNSSRSNRYFDNSDVESFGHIIRTGEKGRYYPGDNDKGDVARILMYMVIRYAFLGLTDHVEYLSRPAYTEEAGYMGKLSVLLEWHEDDPVDSFEKRRNNVIFEYQNNRNPFIDHPELFKEVFAYLLEVDNKRPLTVTLYFEFVVNYSELKREKNGWVN